MCVQSSSTLKCCTSINFCPYVELENMLSRQVSDTIEHVQKAVTFNKLALDASKELTVRLRMAMEADKESVSSMAVWQYSSGCV